MRSKATVTTHDGLHLYVVMNTVTRPLATVLIVHGLCEHQGRYEYPALRLNAQGFNVCRFDQRGHGRSDGQRTHYEVWTDISDDVRAVFDHCRAEDASLPFFILGHSMGGYAAACFATRFPGLASGFILSGAPTRYNLELVGPLPLDMGDKEYLPFAMSVDDVSDPAVARSYADDPLVENKFTAGLMNCLGEGIGYLKAHPDRFTDPVLILQGLNDTMVAEQDSRELFAEIAAADKSLRIYAGLMHDLFEEFDKDLIIDDCLEWLKRRLA